MKSRLFAFILILISFLTFLPNLAFAKEETENIFVKKGEVINRDFFAAGESVAISGTVNGDVYAAGGSISVDGTINGDLIAGGGIITILGEVSDDVRIGGGNVLINGTIGKNLTVGGGSVVISNEARIGGSILAFAGTIDIKGPIGREANVFAGKVIVDNKIGGYLKGAMEDLVLTSEAQIAGDLEYESEREAEVDEEAIIIGETTHKLPEKEISKRVVFEGTSPLAFGISRIKIFLSITSFIFSLILGLLFIYLFPKRAEGIVKILESRYWASLGVGFLAMILFIPAIVLLALSLIGIPFIFLLIPLFVFFAYFSKVFAALCLGKKILLRFDLSKSQTWGLFLGLLIYYLLRQIPIISPLTAFAFAAFGLGAFILDQKALRKASRKS